MNKIRPLWLWIFLILIVVVLALETRLRTQEVHSKAEVPRLTKNYVLFVPSPYELGMILDEKDIWPRRFGPKQPPEISDMPVIYSTYMRKKKLSRDEIDFFRSLAMTASLSEWDTFKEILSFRIQLKQSQLSPEGLLAWIKNEKCSVYGQEVAFRLAQWDPSKNSVIGDVFKKCDANSFHSLWFEILNTLETNKPEAVAALREKVQNKRQLMPNDSFEFFLLTQVFESIDIMMVHTKK